MENRRARLGKWLQARTRPAYMGNIFVGPMFKDYGEVMEFLSLVPEASRRERVKGLIDKVLRPFQSRLLLPAGHADEILDHMAGLL